MKKLIGGLFLGFALLAACAAYGGVPPMNVTVSDAGGKTAFKGVTTGSGTFATANLTPGNYVVQFNATSGGMKGNRYAIVVSAGAKKVVASAVPGEKFSGGGVALRVVVGSGLNVTGQVAPEAEGSTVSESRKIDTREINRIQQHQDLNRTKESSNTTGR
jgi:hypothetical protein